MTHSIPKGVGSKAIAAALESGIAAGRLGPGERLPTVRELSAELEVSPGTIAAAYRTLRQRGLVSASGRRGTIVASQPPLRVRSERSLPPDARDLATGNPDHTLLPPLAPALARLETEHKLYGGPAKLPRLVELAETDFRSDRIAGELAIVGGALDGIERILQAELRPGDAVVIEDPSWPRISDLVHSLGLRLEPVPVDRRGLLPEALERALEGGARAVIATPRGQNPTGAAVDRERGRLLSQVLGQHPDALVLEDDYLAAVAGAPYVALHDGSPRWAVIRSLSKVLGPDLRVATVAGDSLTISRLEGRQLLGPGWVSHLLQQTAAQLWGSPETKRLLARAERVYAEHRAALVDALAEVGVEAEGDSGLGVWIPVPEEVATVQQLADQGWAVSAGERYRFEASPGIRVTTTTLQPAEAKQLAAALAESVRGVASTYSG